MGSSWFIFAPLVVIHYFHVFRSRIGPSEANSPLVVYADAVLPCAIAFERFQTVSGWYAQILQAACDFKLANLAPCDRSDIRESTTIEAA